jgi:hypothetical protein
MARVFHLVRPSSSGFAARVVLSLTVLVLTGCAAAAVPTATDQLTATASPTAPLFTPTPFTPTALAPTELAAPPAEAALPAPETLMALLPAGVEWKVFLKEVGSDQPLLAVNASLSFHPASLLKIPLAMAVLKIQEREGHSLSDLEAMGLGVRNFAALLEAMVVRSEADASATLEYYARGEGRLREILDEWGLKDTGFDPMRSTALDLAAALELLYSGSAINAQFTAYLLGLMKAYTANDVHTLGQLKDGLPQAELMNKRGSLLNPTIVADMGILVWNSHAFIVVIAGTPAEGSSATFESIQADIESFAGALAQQLIEMLQEQ